MVIIPYKKTNKKENKKWVLEYADRCLKSANDWDNKKEDLEKEIKIPIYFYIDNKGNKVYDFEGMTEEFEEKLSELVINKGE